ncbi:MAG: cell division protein ZipA C-terminal FtsZ-binding domain-containing protein [Pseudomonadota bacterium]|nr:cell division protein ZipA C-terminal FtsZ-binding domain-containing protein [Pseudomonadota bacterium]
MAELRWILAGLSALLLAGIWWWGVRRSRQARGNAELRESSGSPAEPEVAAAPRTLAGTRDWGVPPFEPLSIRTADFEQVQMPDLPMTAHVGSLEETELDFAAHGGEAGLSAAPAEEAAPAHGMQPVGNASDSPAAAAPSRAAEGETQRIVTLRVCAADEARWSGADLMAALENHGLAYGRYHVFHRKHSDGQTLFCAASLVEPGTFNIAQMPHEQYRGLTLFAVIPGPADPLHTLDALIETAGQLAEALHGTVQDAKGMPLSLQRVAALREDVARFQAQLTVA